MTTLRILSLFFLVGLTLLVTGCNTVRGIGEDISGSSNFVEKKMMGCEDTSVPSNNPNPPQWPK